MGALLLIVVVVVAVASLAVFLSVAEKNAEARNSYLTNLKNENLQVTFAQFKANATKSAHSDPLLWNNVTLAIRNTNTQNSGLQQIKAGAYWFVHWNQLDPTARHVITNQTSGKGLLYGGGGPPLLIPAKATLYVLLNFTLNGQIAPPRNTSITVTLITAAGNFFTAVYSPPSALEKISIGTVSYQYFNRDILNLDGSLSQSYNSTQILSYQWAVEVPKGNASSGGCNTAAFNTPNDFKKVQQSGKVTQFFQEGYQSGALKPLNDYCVAGPFKVDLTVTDSLGFIGNSSSIIVPQDAAMAPVAQFNAAVAGTCGALDATITGRVFSVLGTPVANVIVLTTHSGIANVNPSYSTNSTGFFTFGTNPCSSGATVTLYVNSLPSQTIILP